MKKNKECKEIKYYYADYPTFQLVNLLDYPHKNPETLGMIYSELRKRGYKTP